MVKKSLVFVMLLALFFASGANASMYEVKGTFGSNYLDAVVTSSDTLNAVGGYNVSGITGSISGYGAIASLVNNPNAPYYWTDQNPAGSGGANLTASNVSYSYGSHLYGGVVFLLQNGLTGLLWSNADNTFNFFLGNYDIYSRNIAASISSVPLPPAGLMFIMVLAGLVVFAVANQRTKRNAV